MISSPLCYVSPAFCSALLYSLQNSIGQLQRQAKANFSREREGTREEGREREKEIFRTLIGMLKAHEEPNRQFY